MNKKVPTFQEKTKYGVLILGKKSGRKKKMTEILKLILRDDYRIQESSFLSFGIGIKEQKELMQGLKDSILMIELELPNNKREKDKAGDVEAK